MDGHPRSLPAGACSRVRRGAQPAAVVIEAGSTVAIAATDGDHVLGSCGLVAVTAQHLVAEVVYAVAPWARGRKVAQRAARLLCDWAITDVGVARLEFYVEPSNVASRAVAARLGCQFEGVLRSKALIQGTRRNMALYALLKYATNSRDGCGIPTDHARR
jgi:RimJ/RimL family protein N-acetyltransferase